MSVLTGRFRRFAPAPWPTRCLRVALLGMAAAISAACASSANTTPFHQEPGITKIKHIIVIMQENRSFDSYFGTYPGADGIPMQNGQPTVCVNDPKLSQCVKP